MNIEFLLQTLAYSLPYYDDREKIKSLVSQLSDTGGLTEKQRAFSLKLVSRYKQHLIAETGLSMSTIESLITGQVFSSSIRVLKTNKQIKVIDVGNEKEITVESPYNTDIYSHFKKYRAELSWPECNYVRWDPNDACWKLEYNEPNVQFVSKLLTQGFEADEAFLDAVSLINEAEKSLDFTIPMLVYENGRYKFVNTAKGIPELDTNSLIEALVSAKRYGISCYDEATAQAVNNANDVNHSLVNALTSNDTGVKCENSPLSLDEIEYVIPYYRKILVVIPGGSEASQLKAMHQFFKNLGVENSQMSALFRVDSSYGRVCNDYIKEHSLNNRLDKNTQVVFLSGKLQKPVLETDTTFDIVLCLGLNSAYYTLRNYIRYHPNAIRITTIKESDFAEL